MIIEKLNAICHRHSRWLFGSFTVVIIVSFLGFLTPGQFGLDFSDPRKVSVGEAFGKKVTYEDLMLKKRSIAVFYRLVYNMDVDTGRLPDTAAFEYICLENKAASLGLAVSDSEVADFLKTLPVFAVEGKYVPENYKKVCQAFAASGISEGDIVEACRSQLLQEKMKKELFASINVTDSEAKAAYRYLNTTFSGKVYEFSAPGVAGIKPSKEELQKYYDANKTQFIMPGTVSAVIAEFTVAKDEDRNAVEKTAHDFASAVYDVIEKDGYDAAKKVFSTKAAAVSAKIITGSAKANDDSIGKVKSADLVKKLVAASKEVPVTEPVYADKKIYVGFMLKNTPARSATMQEAIKDITAGWTAAKAAELSAANAAKTSKAVVEAKDTAAKAKILAADKNCKVSAMDFSFAAKAPAAGMELAAQQMSQMKMNEFSKVIPGASGPVIVQLTGRTAPDMKNFDAEKEKYIQIVKQQKMQLLIQQLGDDIANECRYTGLENSEK